MISTSARTNHPIGRPRRTRSGDQMQLLGDVHRLCAAPDVQLAEHPAGMCLHRVLADEERRGDLASALAGGNLPEDLELARRESQFERTSIINDEWLPHRPDSRRDVLRSNQR